MEGVLSESDNDDNQLQNDSLENAPVDVIDPDSITDHGPIDDSDGGDDPKSLPSRKVTLCTNYSTY